MLSDPMDMMILYQHSLVKGNKQAFVPQQQQQQILHILAAVIKTVIFRSITCQQADRITPYFNDNDKSESSSIKERVLHIQPTIVSTITMTLIFILICENLKIITKQVLL